MNDRRGTERAFPPLRGRPKPAKLIPCEIPWQRESEERGLRAYGALRRKRGSGNRVSSGQALHDVLNIPI